jgi:transketolase
MLDERSKEIRRKAFELSKANGGYHFGGSFSCAEILIALFDRILKPDDVFILSKGHGCWCYYALLQEKGFYPTLEGHPHRDPHNGIPWTTGSLGHGLPAAFGMALARKILGKPGRIFVLMGDGELQEGTTWETMLLAGKHQTDNLIAIVDNNECQGSDYCANVLFPAAPLLAALPIAGWAVQITDGHHVNRLCHTITTRTAIEKPYLIFADTVKGRGVSFMEGKPEWHARFPNQEQEAQLLEELS